MGQKVNPISLRLQKTNRHFDSCWYDDYNYTHLLLQDLKIKNYLKTVLDQIKYPESRVINLGVPKKNIYNLFYYNPSNSRRKKSKRFQLQNFKEKNAQNGQTSKNKKGFLKQNRNLKEKVDSFFSFPKQQYWKNNTFTLAQQRTDEVTVYSPLLPPKKVLKGDVKTKSSVLLSPNRQTLTSDITSGDLSTLLTSDITKGNVRSDVCSVGKKGDVTGLGAEYTTEESVRSLPFVNTANSMMMSRLTSPKIYCDKKKSFFDINQLLLEFVMKSNNNSNHRSAPKSVTSLLTPPLVVSVPTLQSSVGKSPAVNKSKMKQRKHHLGDVSAPKSEMKQRSANKSSICQSGQSGQSDVRICQPDLQNSNIQRFFVRYLLAQLYCNYLQNKNNYNKESITTLSRFLVFFQEKNVKKGVFLKKYRNFKSGNKKVSYTHIANHITSTMTSPLEIGEGIVSDLGTLQTSLLLLPEVNKSEILNRDVSSVDTKSSLTSHITNTSEEVLKGEMSTLLTSDVTDTSLEVLKGNLSTLQTSLRDVSSVGTDTTFGGLLRTRSDVCSVGKKSDVNNDFSGFFQSKKNNLFDITRSDVKKKKNIPLYNRSGVYSSNLVYKSHLEFSLSKQYSSGFTVNLFRTLIEKQSAFFWVQEIIYYLERKIPFRRIKTQILKEAPHYRHIKGIRIKCSGRVGGRSKKAQRSKTQSVKMGQTSLGVFSSKIDFACKSASTRFGLVGVKVWVCYK